MIKPIKGHRKSSAKMVANDGFLSFLRWFPEFPLVQHAVTGAGRRRLGQLGGLGTARGFAGPPKESPSDMITDSTMRSCARCVCYNNNIYIYIHIIYKLHPLSLYLDPPKGYYFAPFWRFQ